MKEAAIRPGAKVTGVFSLRNGKRTDVQVSPLCSCCDNPGTHLVAAKDDEDNHHELICLGCLANGLAKGWYPYGVKIRKRV